VAGLGNQREWATKFFTWCFEEARPRDDRAITVHFPVGTLWVIDRLLFSERLKVASRAELERDWSMEDVMLVNAQLDAFEKAEALARKRAEADARLKTPPGHRR
jgi:hypothetical protein